MNRRGVVRLAALLALLSASAAHAQMRGVQVAAPVPGGGAAGVAGAVSPVNAVGFAPLSPMGDVGGSLALPSQVRLVAPGLNATRGAAGTVNLALPVGDGMPAARTPASAQNGAQTTAISPVDFSAPMSGFVATPQTVPTWQRSTAAGRFLASRAQEREGRSEAPQGFAALRRLGSAASSVLGGSAASADGAREIDQIYDGGAANGGQAAGNDEAGAKANPWALAPAGSLPTALAAVAAIPLPAAVAENAHGLANAAGPVAVIGLAVAGLGLLVFNVKQAVQGVRNLRALEAEVSAFRDAVAIQSRNEAAIKAATGAQHVGARQREDGQWELVAYHQDAARAAAQKALPAVEGLTVRAEAITPETILKLMDQPATAASRAAQASATRVRTGLHRGIAWAGAAAALAAGAAALALSGTVAGPWVGLALLAAASVAAVKFARS